MREKYECNKILVRTKAFEYISEHDYLKIKGNVIQECIPVGCVPPAH